MPNTWHMLNDWRLLLVISTRHRSCGAGAGGACPGHPAQFLWMQDLVRERALLGLTPEVLGHTKTTSPWLHVKWTRTGQMHQHQQALGSDSSGEGLGGTAVEDRALELGPMA